MEINLSKIKRVHFVGIKGVAMAAMAIYCKERGMKITGSDVTNEFPTDEELKKAKISVYEGFDASRMSKTKLDMVMYTGAHGGKDNPEVVEAERLGIPTLPHGKALGEVMKNKRQIVVAGSHGKTTASAMIATILETANKEPSYAIGCGSISKLGPGGHFGRGEWFVAEGDEYVTDPGHDQTPRFLWTTPEILVVTNIDFDHPDVYENLHSVQESFRKLQKHQVEQKLTVVNIDDPASSPLLAGENVITYGFSPRADLRITHVGAGRERMFFTLEQKGVHLGEFAIKVPGRHNVANATACIAVCLAVGLSVEEIRNGLLAFLGTKRRFEKIEETKGVIYYDDYAHHPKEIMATLAAAKTWYPNRRIIAVFQPHTYSRTKALLRDFSHAFTDAHIVVLTDIYASARETATLGITGQTLASETAKHHPSVQFAKDSKTAGDILESTVQPGDIVFFMGAGDIYSWGRNIWKKN